MGVALIAEHAVGQHMCFEYFPALRIFTVKRAQRIFFKAHDAVFAKVVYMTLQAFLDVLCKCLPVFRAT